MPIRKALTEKERKKRLAREANLERQKRVEEAARFIQKREQIASRMGGDPQLAQARASEELAIKEDIKLQEREAERVKQQREEKATEFLKEREFFKEKRPTEVTELDVEEKKGIKKVGVLGPSLAVLEKHFSPTAMLEKATGLKLKPEWFGFEKDAAPEEIRTLIENPKTMRELALQQIQQNVIDEGLTAAENFGAIMEAIPVFGGAVDKFAGRMVEDPAQNVDTIVESIGALGTIAMNTREKVLTGKAGDPFEVFDMLNKMEEKVVAMEMRIKLLLIQSSVLQADADQVNRIEIAIFDARLRISDAKESAAIGMVSPATDASIYLTLQREKLKGGK